MKATLISLLLVTLGTAAFAQFGRVIYLSPDERLRATVIPTKKADGDFHESRVEVRNSSGKQLAARDHSSPDHGHGRGVLQAAWTPDSQFFVYSTTSSGGHSAWHFETFVFVRTLSRFFELDDVIGDAIVDPDFMLSNRSTFHGRRMGRDGQYQTFEVQLTELPWTKKT